MFSFNRSTFKKKRLSSPLSIGTYYYYSLIVVLIFYRLLYAIFIQYWRESYCVVLGYSLKETHYRGVVAVFTT